MTIFKIARRACRSTACRSCLCSTVTTSVARRCSRCPHSPRRACSSSSIASWRFTSSTARTAAPAALAAPLLVLRPPVGLHRLPAGHGHGLDDRCRVLRGARSSATPLVARRDRDDRPRSASACGCTTCSPRGMPQLSMSFFSAASMAISIPSAIQIVRAGSRRCGGPAGRARRRCCLRSASSRRSSSAALSGVITAARPVRLAGHRHVLRGRAPSLRAHRRQRLPGVRAPSTTGSRSDGPDADERLGKLELLADVRRLQCRRSSPCTSIGLLGMPPAHLHLSASTDGASANFDLSTSALLLAVGRRCDARRTSFARCARRKARRQSLERRHARVGHRLAAAAYGFVRISDRRDAASPVGRARRARRSATTSACSTHGRQTLSTRHRRRSGGHHDGRRRTRSCRSRSLASIVAMFAALLGDHRVAVGDRRGGRDRRHCGLVVVAPESSRAAAPRAPSRRDRDCRPKRRAAPGRCR